MPEPPRDPAGRARWVLPVASSFALVYLGVLGAFVVSNSSPNPWGSGAAELGPPLVLIALGAAALALLAPLRRVGRSRGEPIARLALALVGVGVGSVGLAGVVLTSTTICTSDGPCTPPAAPGRGLLGGELLVAGAVALAVGLLVGVLERRRALEGARRPVPSSEPSTPG